MKFQYLVMDPDLQTAEGNTLQECVESYYDIHGGYDTEDLVFYERLKVTAKKKFTFESEI